MQYGSVREVLTKQGKGVKHTTPIQYQFGLRMHLARGLAKQKRPKSRSGPQTATGHKIRARWRLIQETNRGNTEGFTRKKSRQEEEG